MRAVCCDLHIVRSDRGYRRLQVCLFVAGRLCLILCLIRMSGVPWASEQADKATLRRPPCVAVGHRARPPELAVRSLASSADLRFSRPTSPPPRPCGRSSEPALDGPSASCSSCTPARKARHFHGSRKFHPARVDSACVGSSGRSMRPQICPQHSTAQGSEAILSAVGVRSVAPPWRNCAGRAHWRRVLKRLNLARRNFSNP